MDYAEFRLRIRKASPGPYELTLETSPVGGATLHQWQPRLSRHLQQLFDRACWHDERRRELLEGDGERLPAASSQPIEWDEALQRELGCYLFDLLFVGSVRDRLTRSLDAIRVLRTRGRGPTALRLRLTFGTPGEPESIDALHQLAALPWELLYSPDCGIFFSLADHTPIVRTVDAPVYLPPLEVDPPLEVLVVEALPKDRGYLCLGEEIRKLGDQLGDTSLIRLDLLRSATLDAMRHRLKRRTFHVLHFLGHGSAGQLALQDADGGSHNVAALEFAELFREHRSLRLAVLNACHTASFTTSESGHLFRGVATALTLAGVPSVVATQASIMDAPAIDFADALYQALAANEPIELAVTRGRQAIREKALQRARELKSEDGATCSRMPSSAPWQALQWPTPVLYSRVESGRLFEVLPVIDLFGIRFRRVAGVYLAERPLTQADWNRIEGEPASGSDAVSPLTGKTISATESLFSRSRERARGTNQNVATLRLPSEEELRIAYRAGARGLTNGDLPYNYCTRRDPSCPYGAVKGDSPTDVRLFEFDGWDPTYSLRCVVRPVVELQHGLWRPGEPRSQPPGDSKEGCDQKPPSSDRRSRLDSEEDP